MKNLLTKLNLFVLLHFFNTIIIYAQYTLTNNDVVIKEGIIQSCSYNISDTNIIIPDTLDEQPVIGIRNGSSGCDGVFFNKCISSVKLPSTLISIGDFAFFENALTNLDLSCCKSLTYIGKEAFFSNNLINLNLSNCKALTTIENSAFGANLLSSLNLSDCKSLIYIGEYAFSYNSIVSLDFSNCIALTYIGDDAFSNNSINSLNLNKCISLISIGCSAFSSNAIFNLDLSECNALSFIGKYAFYNNPNLEKLILPQSKYNGFIGWMDIDEQNYKAGDTINDFSTFYHANIPYILTDDDVVVSGGIIQSSSFNCKFTNIIIPEILDNQTVIGIRNGNTDKEGVFYKRSITCIELPSTLQFIGDFAFFENSITCVDFSKCVALTSIGKEAFSFNSINNLDLSNCNVLTYIGNSAFSVNRIKNLNLNSCCSLNSIGELAFLWNSIQEIDLSYCTALSLIGRAAFADNKLRDFKLPVPLIKDSQFEYWQDGNGNKHRGLAVVHNLETSYILLEYEK